MAKSENNKAIVIDNTAGEVDIKALASAFWKERVTVAIIVLLVTLIAALIAMLQTNIYRADILVASAEARESASPLSSQLGSAASLVGINLNTSDNGSRIINALAIAQSREFIIRFINEHDLLVPLFAGSWDASEGESKIDSSIYDVENETWRRQGGKPTPLVAYRKFSDLLNIIENENGIVTVSIRWNNPEQAADWTNKLIADINRDLKSQDTEEANRAIEFLRRQLESTQLIEMQRVFYDLIESQTRVIMLADARDEYIFKIIDPAMVPDQPVSPNRLVTIALGMILGFILGLLYIFLNSVFGFSFKSFRVKEPKSAA